ncbi:hypothetical protein F5Y17DRAFT_472361 [Xylariaceae sp. FL0594]|nr:hypothetical protein F5Y17DRAFT_472361 [Xylariaceae sp. FL0594]
MSSRKIPVTLSFQKRGVTPPLFVAGTFSDPPWHPYEMEASADQHGVFVFTKQVMVDEASEIQYKFRHASDDWWELDPDADTTTDSQGNVNNILRLPQRRDTQETSGAEKQGLGNDDANRERRRRLSLPPLEEPARTAAEVADSAVLLDGDSMATEEDKEKDSDEHVSPLFSHEVFISTDEEQALGDEQADAQQESHAGSSENPDESSVNFDDPALEHFPSDRDSIIAAVRRLSMSVRPDPTTVDVAPMSPMFKPSEGMSPSTESGSCAIDDATSPTQLGRPSAAHGASRTSLQSIAENEEVVQEEIPSAAAEEVGTNIRRKPLFASPGSREDEGIAMSVTPPMDMSEDAHDSANYTTRAAADAGATGMSTPRMAKQGADTAGSSDPIDSTDLHKPVNSERPSSPSSTLSLRKSEHVHLGSWLGAFIRTLLFAWPCSFVCWLFGRRRKHV